MDNPVTGHALSTGSAACAASHLMGVGAMSHTGFTNCREKSEGQNSNRPVGFTDESRSLDKRWLHSLKGNVRPCSLICSSTSGVHSVFRTMNGGEQILSSDKKKGRRWTALKTMYSFRC